MSNVAYVVISHGATGYGAWTISGSRKSYSDVKGDELKNTSANGPFTIRAFSDVDWAEVIIDRRHNERRQQGSPWMVDRRGRARRARPDVDARVRAFGWAIVRVTRT